MAGLLTQTLREWAATSAPPYPCGLAIYSHACAVAQGQPQDLPHHQSRREIVAMLRPHGGIIGFAASLVEPLGWHRLALGEALRRGDIGVVNFAAMGSTCALFLGERWAAKGDRSILIAAANPGAVWRFVPCQPQSQALSSPQSV